MNRLVEAKKVFDIEIEALKRTRNALDDVFENILDEIIHCKGKVVVTGIGKPGHIAQKMAATFSSLGTPSFYLHPGEAMHGDLGMVSADDIVIIISYSGESDEILKILPNLKLIGAKLVGITGNKGSTLAEFVDYLQVFPKFTEACHLGLAPTASTTVELCYGDALAVVASEEYGFREVDFGKFHPAGALGKKLLITVEQLMSKDEANAVIDIGATLKDAIVELSKKGLGVVSIVKEENYIEGVITDGNLRRLLENQEDIYSLFVRDVMTKKPYCIESDRLAIEALNCMKENNISCLPVLKDGKIVGTIRLQDIIRVGIIG